MANLMQREHLAEVLESNERFQVIKLDNGLTITLAERLRVKDAQVGDTVEVVYTATSQATSGSGFYYGVRVVK